MTAYTGAMPAYSQADFEAYYARADAKRANEISGTTSPYTIEVRFLGGLTDSQKQVFKDAADRWTRLIVGDLPSVRVGQDVIDDVVIEAQGGPIDGVGHILGQAGPVYLRPQGAGESAHLPAKGAMIFDTADLAAMEQRGILNDVITHEMGHVIGMVGDIWDRKGLVTGANTPQWAFVGQLAQEEYGKLVSGQARPVPVEDQHGPGTAGSHWRESVFGSELMSGFVSSTSNPLSRVTGALFGDIGYDVDLSSCDAYALPSHLEYEDLGIVLPSVAFTLEEEALDI